MNKKSTQMFQSHTVDKTQEVKISRNDKYPGTQSEQKARLNYLLSWFMLYLWLICKMSVFNA